MERYRCQKCNAEFSTREQLEQHAHQHGTEGTRPGGSVRSQEQTGGSYRCPRCGVQFQTREELDRHERAQHQAT
jgi:DNA-directed RNA polymerase subunit RPC12/RpoP